MIKELELTNVRRHASTLIDFTGEGQLIALSGSNGAGKSTILEAIVYALYGETRHGRSGIAGMVRRGAVHEGMQVRLAFDIDGVDYEVTRRYEKGKSTASLKVNSVETMRSVAAVSSEITRILGMDCAGFKLATIAKQKELDGLADLTPAKRRAAIARLLRLDAVQAANRQARDKYLRSKDLASVLSAQADPVGAKARLEKAQQAYREAKAAEDESRERLEELESLLTEGQTVEQEWNAALAANQSAQAVLEAVTAQVSSLEEQVASVVVPGEPEETRTIGEIDADLTDVNRKIAEGVAAARTAANRARVKNDLDKCLDDLERVKSSLGKYDVTLLSADLEDVTSKSDEASKKHARLATKQRELVSAHAKAAGAVGALKDRQAELEELEATCQLCGQEVSPEHQATLAAELEVKISQALTALDELSTQLGDVDLEFEDTASLIDQLKTRTESLRTSLAGVNALEEKASSLESAAQTYEQMLSRLPEATVDMDSLYELKGTLEVERATATAADTARAARSQALAQKSSLSKALVLARSEADKALVKVEEAALSQELKDRWDAVHKVMVQKEAEGVLCDALTQASSGCAGELKAAKEQLENATNLAQQANEHRSAAAVAAKAAQVLAQVAKTLSTEVRPLLQAEVSMLLESLSEGRFTSVNIDEDYNVTVADDDAAYHPVDEYSGGESDLIALAIRLALAQVVARRHGAGSTGFLILDEVLGSQDAGRRVAILEGLRRLRGVYGQILLISHVGGMEDAADRVIEVETVDGVSTTS